MVDVVGPHQPIAASGEVTDRRALADCVAESAEMLNAARRVVVLAGVEMHRFGLQEPLVRLVEKANFHVAATLLGKSVIDERHELYLGIYEGAMGQPGTRRFVEQADCVLMLGCMMTDIDLGIFTARLDPGRVIFASSDQVAVRRHKYVDVPLRSFVKAMLRAAESPRAAGDSASSVALGRASAGCRAGYRCRPVPGGQPRHHERAHCGMRHRRLVLWRGRPDHPRRTDFLSSPYYASMGFAVPAAVGSQFVDCRLRPIVLVGDGAFQMTGMELSTAAKYRLTPIVIVLNNHGYGTERQIKDGPFNDIHLWDFAAIPHVLGAGKGFTVRTMGELRRALEESLACRDQFCILDVDLDPYDISRGIRRLGQGLGRKLKK